MLIESSDVLTILDDAYQRAQTNARASNRESPLTPAGKRASRRPSSSSRGSSPANKVTWPMPAPAHLRQTGSLFGGSVPNKIG